MPITREPPPRRVVSTIPRPIPFVPPPSPLPLSRPPLLPLHGFRFPHGLSSSSSSFLSSSSSSSSSSSGLSIPFPARPSLDGLPLSAISYSEKGGYSFGPEAFLPTFTGPITSSLVLRDLSLSELTPYFTQVFFPLFFRFLLHWELQDPELCVCV